VCTLAKKCLLSTPVFKSRLENPDSDEKDALFGSGTQITISIAALYFFLLLVISYCIVCFFKCHLKVVVVVNATRILCVICVFALQTDDWCVHSSLFNANFEVKKKNTRYNSCKTKEQPNSSNTPIYKVSVKERKVLVKK
jgi:hypothetical protein